MANPTLKRAAIVGLAGGVVAAGLAGCRGDRSDATPRRFFPDMDEEGVALHLLECALDQPCRRAGPATFGEGGDLSRRHVGRL